MFRRRRDRAASQTCTRVFNMLWKLAGPELFQRLFFVILTDKGSELSDPDMIEKWWPDPEHNPTKLLPRGIHRKRSSGKYPHIRVSIASIFVWQNIPSRLKPYQRTDGRHGRPDAAAPREAAASASTAAKALQIVRQTARAAKAARSCRAS